MVKSFVLIREEIPIIDHKRLSQYLERLMREQETDATRDDEHEAEIIRVDGPIFEDKEALQRLLEGHNR